MESQDSAVTNGHIRKEESSPPAATSKEPRLTILPRPKDAKVVSPQMNAVAGNVKAEPKVKPVAPQKTLEQREQEYAEARRRLLGDVTFPEEEREAEMESQFTPAEILKMKIDEAMQNKPS